MQGNPAALVASLGLALPPANYTAGATVFAAFTAADGAGYEVFVAIGRPGEPIGRRAAVAAAASTTAPADQAGVDVNRYTTVDFKTYSAPTTVLFLPNGPTNDGNIWTVSSTAELSSPLPEVGLNQIPLNLARARLNHTNGLPAHLPSKNNPGPLQDLTFKQEKFHP